jgi:hypothetical protein
MIAQGWSDVSAANVAQPWVGVSCPLALAASAATRRPHDSPAVERCERSERRATLGSVTPALWLSLRQPQRGDPMIAQRWSDVSAANVAQPWVGVRHGSGRGNGEPPESAVRRDRIKPQPCFQPCWVGNKLGAGWLRRLPAKSVSSLFAALSCATLLTNRSLRPS